MTVTVSNIVLPGPCKVYMCPLASAASAPAATILYGTAWGGTWVEVGFTMGGVVAETSFSNYVVQPDQYNAGVAEARTQDGIKVTFAMLEATLTNIKQALGIGTITTGSTESTFGVAGNDMFVTPYGLGFESYAPGASASSAKYRRLIVWRAIQDSGFQIEAKRDAQQQIGASFHGQIDTSQASTEQLWKLIDRVV